MIANIATIATSAVTATGSSAISTAEWRSTDEPTTVASTVSAYSASSACSAYCAIPCDLVLASPKPPLSKCLTCDHACHESYGQNCRSQNYCFLIHYSLITVSNLLN